MTSCNHGLFLDFFERSARVGVVFSRNDVRDVGPEHNCRHVIVNIMLKNLRCNC